MNRRVAVRGIVTLGDKILCAKLKPYHGAVHGDFWCIPGGGVDPGEPLLTALEREMIEETGIKPAIGELLYIQQFAHEGLEHLEFFFHVTNGEDYTAIDLSATTHGGTEIATIEFIQPAGTTLLPRFLTTEPVAEHIAKRAPVKIFNMFNQ
jgi:ADP-ribose pyrophosphatase YjhB (NUDIX family)